MRCVSTAMQSSDTHVVLTIPMQHAAAASSADAEYLVSKRVGFPKAILRLHKLLALTVRQCHLGLYARLHVGLAVNPENCPAHLSDPIDCLLGATIVERSRLACTLHKHQPV